MEYTDTPVLKKHFVDEALHYAHESNIRFDEMRQAQRDATQVDHEDFEGIIDAHHKCRRTESDFEYFSSMSAFFLRMAGYPTQGAE